MKRIGLLLVFLIGLSFTFHSAHAQTDPQGGFVSPAQPLILVMNADGTIEPAMQEYFERGIRAAEQRNAEALIIQLNTPGGDLQSMDNIIQDIGASTVPVVIYVAPNSAMAGSAGALITIAAQVAAMAPEAAIGASSPIDSSGQNLDSTLATKQKEIMKATIRPLVERRGADATQLAQDMIDNAKAVSASEALQAHLIDFTAVDVNDVVKKLDGFTVTMSSGTLTLHTANAVTEPLDMNLIEQLLLILTDSNFVFILLSVGVLALQIELSHPGTWVPGFIGVVCLALAIYGMGLLSVNWFGLIFVGTAFVLFILDIKAPTHGALTLVGIASFIFGALMLFNSPSVPSFERVSVPLVVAVGIAIGLMFAAIVTFALRTLHSPLQSGVETMVGKTGYAKRDFDAAGQVQVGSELWTAEAADGSGQIREGERVEVVEVKGLRLKVRKI
ncbi:MAG TPA: nodulation protein NfeD [Anaerolineales bacterium]|nr:nodulation protein NfeD [Anaerolineales bacterium]